MRHLTRLHRGLLVGIATAVAMLSAAQVAGAAPKEGPTVPNEIAVPGGNKLFLVGHATGVQIYTCNNGVWGPGSTPRATLVDDKQKVVATHFAGPTWQARDGSTVVGARKNGVNAPDPTKAIPSLLLSATSTAAGPDGDQFVKTTFIQRVNTNGGVAPTASCTAADKPVEVPYTADYYFWKATGKPSA